MGDAVRLLSFPVAIASGTLLGWRWPDVMRRIARSLAAATGVALLCIIATGWARNQGPCAAIHRWLSHALCILVWCAVPFSIGVTIARSRGSLLVAIASVLASLATLVAVFLGSISGYLGPSYESLDQESYIRFRVLHYAAFPSLSIVLSAVWYYGLGPHQGASPRVDPGPPDAA